jgi:hypothetical protein
MATAYLATNYSTPMYGCEYAGVSMCREFNFLASTALVINDTIALCPLKGGMMVEDWYIDMPDLDSGSGITWQLGDSTTAARFMTSNVAGRSAAKINGYAAAGVTASLPALILADTNLVLKADAGPAGGGTNTVSIRGWVRYHYTDLYHAFPLPAA